VDVDTIDPKDLIGRTFLKDAEEDGQRFRALVVRAIVHRKTEWKKGHKYMKLICEVPDSIVDEIFTYNEILDHIERDNMTWRMTQNNCISFVVLLPIKDPFVVLIRIGKDLSTTY
jgi:hypothetical protein